jgi:hypothetical protein
LATVAARAGLLVSTTIIHAQAGAFSPSHASHVVDTASSFPTAAVVTEVTATSSTSRNPTDNSFFAASGVNTTDPAAARADCAETAPLADQRKTAAHAARGPLFKNNCFMMKSVVQNPCPERLLSRISTNP